MAKFLKSIYVWLPLVMLWTVSACAIQKTAQQSNQPTNFTINSPEGNIQIVLSNENNQVNYTLSKAGKELIGLSQISILQDATAAKIVGSSSNAKEETWQPTWGQFSEIKNHYNELVLDIDLEGIKAKLYIRAYNQGVGFRYEIEGYQQDTAVDFYCEYNLSRNDALYSSAKERPPIGPLTIKDLSLEASDKQAELFTPIVVESSAQSYLSILESDLYVAPAFGVINFEFDQEKNRLVATNKTKLKGKKTITPWRVILVNEKLGDLLTNTVPLNLATPNQLTDDSWVVPGKSLWDWRVHGYTTEDGFTYGTDVESYKRFIDFASETGIEYFLIDDSWYTKVKKEQVEMVENVDIKEVAAYAKEKEVQLILYYDRRRGNYGDDKLFPYYKSLGAAGIKYGFMRQNVPFSKSAIQKTAAKQLLIDFHDVPVPFTGIERTFPNAITREYCHAQLDGRKAFTPEIFIKMALVNAIQGPLDMTNGNFSLLNINAGNREKGPRKRNSYFSTVASEAARTLIIYSGLVCIPDAPEAYTEKADLFEFIQKMPVGKWDESRVLHAKMGDYISTARRHGEEWFIGSVYNQKGGVLSIDLDFLKEGQSYKVTFYEDSRETHCKTNPEAYQIRTDTVKKGAIIKAIMAPGGGHCMWIRPVHK